MTKRKSIAATPEIKTEIESTFSKNQLLAADRFRDRRDILTVLLSPDKTYTVKTVEQMIENYMKGQVK